MDIFKLFFEHDLQLDQLRERHTDRATQNVEMSIKDFMKPIPVYSKFYITGTRLEEEHFGVNSLAKYEEIVTKLSEVFEGGRFITAADVFGRFSHALDQLEIGQAMIISTPKPSANGSRQYGPDDARALALEGSSHIGHMREELKELLSNDAGVLYKEKAHHGFDLHLLCKENIYPALFNAFKPLIGDTFRFFSINGKKMRSERQFYFETWSLHRPPHGAEEVFPDTVI